MRTGLNFLLSCLFILCLTGCDDNTRYTMTFLSAKIMAPFTVKADNGADGVFLLGQPHLPPAESQDGIPGIEHTTDTSLCDDSQALNKRRLDLRLIVVNLERQEEPRQLSPSAINTLTKTPLCQPLIPQLGKIAFLLTGEQRPTPQPAPVTRASEEMTGLSFNTHGGKVKFLVNTRYAGRITFNTGATPQELQKVRNENRLYINKHKTGKNLALLIEEVPNHAGGYDTDSWTYEESCEVSFQERHCWYDDNRDHQCEYITVYRPGERTVTVNTTTSDDDYFVYILNAQDQRLAKIRFNIEESSSYKSRSGCREL